ncbi:hypothetical protein TTHERM_00794410 (macronuclear) [Tetrahymena thermophila SB210]|uniref:Uncharacterized protein n=1 Tax=Tetrahymena thermophila (strain SB210) TaxID=312017 RepID=Q23VZ0_TETTS|nr:hypothetical protein TTHERM_00794410 [Tetrahymena thermophila SB210]EAS00715.3 hypothetical protein TTHERM_00794410 [Tetrahymena thermophila SB210]|eukprot:XP_001020960.3 hypothetical protein TTHERM_00794410 [Tetrahymena thermophila SB210]
MSQSRIPINSASTIEIKQKANNSKLQQPNDINAQNHIETKQEKNMKRQSLIISTEELARREEIEKKRQKEHQNQSKHNNNKNSQSQEAKQGGKFVMYQSQTIKPVKNQQPQIEQNLTLNSQPAESQYSKNNQQKSQQQIQPDQNNIIDKNRLSISIQNVRSLQEKDNNIFFTSVEPGNRGSILMSKQKKQENNLNVISQITETQNENQQTESKRSYLPNINQHSQLLVDTYIANTQSKDSANFHSNQPSTIHTKKIIDSHKDYEDREPQYQRIRDFKIKVEQKQFLFEGLKLVQFEMFVIREPAMQGIVVRDVLKILADKVVSFKNYLIDRNKMRKVFASLSYSTKIITNIKFEQLIGLLEKIAIIVTQDFKDYPECPSIGESPLEEFRRKSEEYFKKMTQYKEQEEDQIKKQNDMINFTSPKYRGGIQTGSDSFLQNNHRKINTTSKPQQHQVLQTRNSMIEFIKLPLRYDKRYPYYRPEIDTVEQEPYVFEDNIQIYDKVADYLKECIDAYRIMSRQREFKHLNEQNCEELLKLVTQTRFFLSEYGEQLRMFEKNNEDKLRQQKIYQQEKIRNENSLLNISKSYTQTQPLPNIQDAVVDEKKETDKDKNEKLEFIYRVQKLTSLLYNKFNYKRNKFQTRESKVILNQDKFEKEKELLLQSNDLDAAIKSKTIADNRKLVAIKRLRIKDDVNDLKFGNQLQGSSYFKAFETKDQ